MAKRPPEPKLEGAAATIKVLAEGDSWFNLPDLLYPKDALDILNRTHNVISVAKWGDTVENMLAQKQYVQKLKAGTFRHFLFSGGGNDVLGSIGTYVTTRKPGDTDPANAPGYVKASFATKVKGIISGYETLANDVKKTTGTKSGALHTRLRQRHSEEERTLSRRAARRRWASTRRSSARCRRRSSPTWSASSTRRCGTSPPAAPASSTSTCGRR